ncbi:MAG: hypothetical protein ACE10C_10590 [Candidatus Binatia bacterium]
MMEVPLSITSSPNGPYDDAFEAENGIFAHLRQSRRKGRLRTPALGLVGAAAEPALSNTTQ